MNKNTINIMKNQILKKKTINYKLYKQFKYDFFFVRFDLLDEFYDFLQYPHPYLNRDIIIKNHYNIMENNVFCPHNKLNIDNICQEYKKTFEKIFFIRELEYSYIQDQNEIPHASSDRKRVGHKIEEYKKVSSAFSLNNSFHIHYHNTIKLNSLLSLQIKNIEYDGKTQQKFLFIKH